MNSRVLVLGFLGSMALIACGGIVGLSNRSSNGNTFNSGAGTAGVAGTGAAGSAGATAGSSGSAGHAGSSGSAGTATGGHGGSAGLGGSSGSGGSGGSSGSGGSGGSSGSGGSGGSGGSMSCMLANTGGTQNQTWCATQPSGANIFCADFDESCDPSVGWTVPLLAASGATEGVDSMLSVSAPNSFKASHTNSTLFPGALLEKDFSTSDHTVDFTFSLWVDNYMFASSSLDHELVAGVVNLKPDATSSFGYDVTGVVLGFESSGWFMGLFPNTTFLPLSMNLMPQTWYTVHMHVVLSMTNTGSALIEVNGMQVASKSMITTAQTASAFSVLTGAGTLPLLGPPSVDVRVDNVYVVHSP